MYPCPFTGSSCAVTGIESILHEILFNLTDNAIIYNREGGEAHISLTESDGQATLVVEDTGIGTAHELSTAFSNAFTAWTRAIRVRRAERDWGCPSSSTARSCTAPRSGLKANRGRVRESHWSSRAPKLNKESGKTL